MSNSFGGFVHTSPISTAQHDDFLSLSSNIIRDFFGATVQTVADCLATRCISGTSVGGSGANDRSATCYSANHQDALIANHDFLPGLTLAEIEQNIISICRRTLNEDRMALVKGDKEIPGQNKIHMARGPEGEGFVVDKKSIRCALIVLIQHSLVVVYNPDESEKKSSSSGKDSVIRYRYKYDPVRTRLIVRYPRYIQHARQAIDENASIIVEEILIHGRMRVEDILANATKTIYNLLKAEQEEEEDSDEEEDDSNEDEDEEEKKDLDPSSGETNNNKHKNNNKEAKEEAEKAEIRLAVLKSFNMLVNGGYLEEVISIDPRYNMANAKSNGTNGSKKRKFDDTDDGNESDDNAEGEEYEHDHPPPIGIGVDEDELCILSLLTTTSKSKRNQKKIFPTGSVWRVNIQMFHDAIRAHVLGELVKERYDDKIPMAGYVIKAALKQIAHEEHAPNQYTPAELAQREEEKGMFTCDDILLYLPTPVLHYFRSKPGGAKSNIGLTLSQIAMMEYPTILMEAEGSRFEIALNQTVKYLQDRIIHQTIRDHFGDVAARMFNLLSAKGYLEDDVISKMAMIPPQDVREILHRMYKAGFVNLFYIQPSSGKGGATKTTSAAASAVKQLGNPHSAIYLWSCETFLNVRKQMLSNLCKTYLNLRLRRQHEMEIGKDFIDRAKDADRGIADENDVEEDKVNYKKFGEGLIRIDNALLQIDETLMIMGDF
eukprot:CAMPEP_0178961026 /NCGR_PEP_ID=MMETSP0789-20121207/13390_1 /TAXON_ID=3005 /ORGANISM="Rhizosolenia setigera, Strain CCMP 1694" /LENGTH=715 /DNA_ID=CAMNT_0020644639 /DNA_START=84 /DNA_END=2231 /DNA_ORIENTATION=+